MMIEEIARAKVNLTLHITGQRADGYHLLDSLVMFASIGDRLEIGPASQLNLTVTGPEASAVPIESNSVLAAARFLSRQKGADIALAKLLPVASGIGGGTADAAAAYRGCASLWGMAAPEFTPDFCNRVVGLGADLPVCIFSQTSRMSGIGERLEFLPNLPRLDAVLVNPRTEVSTQAVFKSLTDKNKAPMGAIPRAFADQLSFIDWLRAQRNDMQAAAAELEPAISETLAALEATKMCQLARMSGSGATCFGLYPSASAAADAAAHISAAHRDWWVNACTLGD